ncbi:MAG TPA: O-antigen ligase family protein [Anaerolineae bacterium]|nr:O-antigen ligase family protein [Anaerolineae bacterium]
MTYRSSLFSRDWILPALVVLAALSGLLIARLPLTTLIVALGAGVILIGTFIEPGIGLIATLVLGPWAAWQNTYLPGLLPIDVGQLSVGLTLGAWALHGLARREFNFPRLPLLLPLSIFVGWAAVTLLWAPDYAFGLPEVLKWIELVLLALFVGDVAGRRGIRWIVFGLLLSAVVQAGVGIYQARIRGIGPEGFLLSEGVYRAYGSFEQPNPFGGFIGLNLPIAIGLALALWSRLFRTRTNTENTDNRFSRLLFTALLLTFITAVLAVALYLSFSRGAWLGAAVALLVMGLFLPRRRWIGVALIGGLIVIGLGLSSAGLLPAAISDRFADVGALVDFRDVRGVKINDANYAVIERLAHWQAAVRMLEAQPWTGVGFSNYQPVYEQYRLLNWPMPLGHAHNIYLNVAAETGLPGLAAYAALWLAIVVQTIRALRTQSGVWRGLTLGLLGAWTHLAVHHLFDNLYVDNVHLNIGAMIGVLGALCATGRNNSAVLITPEAQRARRIL